MHHELLQVMAGMRNVEDRQIAARRTATRELARCQRRRPGRAARMLWVLPLSLLLMTVFVIASQHADAHTSAARAARAGGTVYGGSTAQDFPVVIDTSKNGRKVIKAIIAIDLTCTSGAMFTLPDGYTGLSVNKKRKFAASFGPETERNNDGTTTDFEGSIRGSFNKARTKVSGTWALKATEHDASGAVTDTCDSGRVSWKATQ